MPTLSWLTRDEDLKTAGRAPYRLLQEVTELGHGDPGTGNMLIQGDNLEALKSLLPFYAGQVKCIYIDPPYNTGAAFEHYDDSLEHSRWLAMMWPRLELLRELLAEDGTIWMSIDDNEGHYLKVIMDEVFGRKNFVNDVSVRMKLNAGASGGGEDKRLKKSVEHLLCYTKNYDGDSGFRKFHDVYEEENLFDVIDTMSASGQSWKYTSVLLGYGDLVESKTILDGSGGKIETSRYSGLKRTTINNLVKLGTAKEAAYFDNFERIFSDTNAQTSIRSRVIEAYNSLEDDEIVVTRYIPRSGRDKNKVVEHYYISPTIRRVIWLRDTAEKRGKSLVKREKLGTYWDGLPLNNLTKEGDVQFPNGKKPEALIQKIFDLATNPGDLVLDSFLGSGTTAAVAMKMRRRFIGIELGDQAVSHCRLRLKNVVSGEQGGVSKAQNWTGGGGFRFWRLGPPVFDETGRISDGIAFATLAAHVWFSETSTPLDPKAKGPLLGVHGNRAVALLYNGVLGDKRPDGGNVLIRQTLAIVREALPVDFDGDLIVYGERSALTPATLAREHVAFKQTPYDVKARR